jgi:hypothetical protein
MKSGEITHVSVKIERRKNDIVSVMQNVSDRHETNFKITRDICLENG